MTGGADKSQFLALQARVKALEAEMAGVDADIAAAIAALSTVYEPKDATLTALAGLDAADGFVTQTAADTFTKRILVATANEIDIADPTGDAGNPTFTLSASIGAAKAFRRGNILATVSQSAGVPTGGLIEYGANGNGEYVRFADGLQICTFTSGSNARAITTATGVLFRTAAAQSRTFAAAFSVAPSVSVDLISGGIIWCVMNAIGTTTCSYFFVSGTSASPNCVECYMAVGRWF